MRRRQDDAARGFHVEPGETAVVIEDVITTGGSSREVYDLLREAALMSMAAGSIIDRSDGQAKPGRSSDRSLASMRVLPITNRTALLP